MLCLWAGISEVLTLNKSHEKLIDLITTKQMRNIVLVVLRSSFLLLPEHASWTHWTCATDASAQKHLFALAVCICCCNKLYVLFCPAMQNTYLMTSLVISLLILYFTAVSDFYGQWKAHEHECLAIIMLLILFENVICCPQK